MLNQTCYYIVGNAYQDFAKLAQIITYNDALKAADSSHSKLRHAYLVLGQGISTEEKEILKKLEYQGKLGPIINRHHELAPRELSHKTHIYNTMITEPLMITKHKSYTAYLVLDDDCAEMSDHITGMHIQGMVLTEAARQMMLAVGEKFLLPPELRGNSYFALRKVNSIFHQFAFPIEMKIIHEIKQLKKRNTTCVISTITKFIQNTKITTEVEIDYIASEKKQLADKEKQMASSVIEAGVENNLIESHVIMCA